MAADCLSHQQLSDTEWQLHLDVFQQIVQRWGTPLVDLFASRNNAQLPRFFSKTFLRELEGLDAI